MYRMMRLNLISVLRGSRAALWAALAALALYQVSYAEHAHEHAVEEVSENCEVCLQLSDIKTSFAGTGSDSALPCAAEDYDAIPLVASAAAATRSTHIRAPPPLL